MKYAGNFRALRGTEQSPVMNEPNKKIRILLPENEALELLLKVNPTAGMARRAAKIPKRRNKRRPIKDSADEPRRILSQPQMMLAHAL